MKGRTGSTYSHTPYAYRINDLMCWWEPAPRWKRWAAKLLGIESPVEKREARITAIRGNLIEYEEL